MLVALTSSADQTGPSLRVVVRGHSRRSSQATGAFSEKIPGEPAPGGGVHPRGDLVFTDTPLSSMVTDNSRTGFTGTGGNGPVGF